MTDLMGVTPLTATELHSVFNPTQTLSMLIHAPSKVGKSTLTSTAPLPVLVLDAEGGWRFINKIGFGGSLLRKKHWDPNSEPPPRYDGTWDVCIVTVRQWNTMLQVYTWLTQSPHDFVSVVFDSVTEVQRRLKRNLVGTENMKIQDWGRLLIYMDDLIRSFRDLVLLPNTSLRCVIFVAETTMDEGKWRPSMEGKIKRAMPYWVDICGYLFIDHDLDAEGQPTIPVRRLLVTPHDQFETGERVQGALGAAVTRPNVTEMMYSIFELNTARPNVQEAM